METTASMANNILDSLTSAIICLDHQLRLCYMNQSAESMLEVSGNRLCGHTISDVLVNSGELQSMLYDALQTGQPYTKRREKLILTSGHPVTVDYSITPISEDEWPKLIVEFHSLDRHLRIDRDEALRDHQQITRQMIRGLAHEIKNPLGGIRGSAQLLARELVDPDQQEYTNIIIEETDRLTSLVDRLLGPKSVPTPANTNIHEVLERVRKLIELEAGDRITVERDYDPSIPEIYIDAELILQALLNIARNAMQSLETIEDPQIRIVTRTERQFTIGKTRHRSVLTIDIIDNGPGIAESVKDHLFYPMISGRPDGTGLGLSFAQSIVHQHAGIIEVTSQPGRTDFTVILPLEHQR